MPDAKTAKENFPDLKTLLFVTSAKVGNADRKQWEEAIQKDHGLELHIIEREEIITLMMMPENASARASFLHLEIHAEPQVADLIDRKGARPMPSRGPGLARQKDIRSSISPRCGLTQMARSLPTCCRLSRSTRRCRRAAASFLRARWPWKNHDADTGRATRAHRGTPFMVELPAWTSSRRGILEFIAGMPAFQAEGLKTADLARVQQTEPFLLLLNGWNEIAESNSAQADHALRELELEFPSAGIIVATRTHHFTPPLPGALRLRLLRLRRVQRAAYLAARLGAKGAELRARIDADPSLDELTRTPFILSEVTSLFEHGGILHSRSSFAITALIVRNSYRMARAPVFATDGTLPATSSASMRRDFFSSRDAAAGFPRSTVKWSPTLPSSKRSLRRFYLQASRIV